MTSEFTTAQVASILNVSLRQLQYADENGIVSPKIKYRRRLYTRRQVEDLMMWFDLKPLSQYWRRQAWDSYRKSGLNPHYGFVLVHGNGSRREHYLLWLNAGSMLAPVDYAGGEPVRIVAVGVEITRIRTAMDNLERMEVSVNG